MFPETQILKYTQALQSSPHQVYQAFTNSTALREWFCDIATTNPKIGGHFYTAWNSGFYACGEFTSLEPDHRIEFTFFGRSYPNTTHVKVTLEEKGSQTIVTLEHAGFGTNVAWEKIIPEIKKGWESSLENLASILQTGQDIRITNRPMLGIVIGDYDEQIAKKLDVPEIKGIRLDTVIDGMGAQAAGLEKNDVIVSVAGTPIIDYGNLNSLLLRSKSGDEVEVIYYRGPVKKKTSMTLSRRSIPAIPQTAKELAKAVKKSTTEFDNEFNMLLEKMNDREAEFHPKPNEWNVKQILAHLIHGERNALNYINDILGNQEPLYDDYSGNQEVIIAATISIFPSLIELRQEYFKNHAEVITALENLPVEFIARKSTFWRLAFNMLEGHYHIQLHLDQIRAAVEAARSTLNTMVSR